MISHHLHDSAVDAALLSPQQIEIRLKLPKQWTHVSIEHWNKYKKEREGVRSIPMAAWAETESHRYYRIVLTGTESRIRYLQYHFQFQDGGKKRWLNAEGVFDAPPEKGSYSYAYAGDRDGIHVPDWIHDRVWYQIFPERFCNGDPGNDPAGTEPWGTAPTRDNYMGGDLKGILDKLDYLAKLGVNALYLNPLFAASSNHKYDTVDYFRIDPQFGTIDDLKKLVAACHGKDIKVVLDLVINHCGFHHPFFQDVVRHGEASRYRDWFYINRYPVELSEDDYDSVGYYRWMPKLRTSNPAVRQYVFDIVTFWQSETNIDGWRIDVADEVELSFLRELNSVVKRLNPNAFIIAEIWDDAKRLMMSGGIDSAMNYVLRDILFDYVLDRSIPYRQFFERLVHYHHRYSLAELRQMYNLLGSHDTLRLFTRCGERTEDLMLLLALQFSLPGNPAVYYGDELAMTGENDPGCRACMPWDDLDEDDAVYRAFRNWIALRKTHPALQRGDLKLAGWEEADCLMVRRTHEAEEFVLIANFSERSVPVSELKSHFRLDDDFGLIAFDSDSSMSEALGARDVLAMQKRVR